MATAALARVDSLLVYSLTSTVLVATMAWQAYSQRRQFYPTVCAAAVRMRAQCRRVCWHAHR